MKDNDLILTNGNWNEIFKVPEPNTVTSLDVSSNKVFIKDIESFPIMNRLQKLNLSNNMIDSSLDMRIITDKYPQLRILFIEDNQLSKEWKIEVKDAGGNIFTDSKFITLQEMSLSRNKLETLNFITELPLLRIFNASENLLRKINGLKNLRYLTNLNLSHNQLMKLTNEISELRSLQHLDASFNLISTYLFH